MRKPHLTIACITLAFALAGCAPTFGVLGADAEAVEFRNDVPRDAEYTYVTEVACEEGNNLRSVGANAQECRNDLRRQAARAGADIIVITTENIGTPDCTNCVILFGEAYRRGAER